jgi:hypothetical protein
MRMRRIFISDLPGSTIFVDVISQTARFSKTKKLLNIKCVFWSLQICLKHFSFSEGLSEIWSQTSSGLHLKCQLPLSDFNETWIFSPDFRKILKYQISWKSVQLESSTKRTDGQTYMTKLIVDFRKFAKAPKNEDDMKYSIHNDMPCYDARLLINDTFWYYSMILK